MKMIQMTKEIISQGENGTGGWNYKQFQLLGIETPPRADWKNRIIGVSFDESTVRQFISLKGKSQPINELQLDLFQD